MYGCSFCQGWKSSTAEQFGTENRVRTENPVQFLERNRLIRAVWFRSVHMYLTG
uniref:Uncharacterized protein n=1 Tax=Rhizophagus irregularis (strain DAOM 181602 / DAOM 197198 / MUCL 43194) TaxID=747089 RepID=U9TAX5_RHIID